MKRQYRFVIFFPPGQYPNISQQTTVLGARTGKKKKRHYRSVSLARFLTSRQLRLD